MTDPNMTALALFLPDKALDHFDITEALFDAGEVCITLTEKNVPPAHDEADLQFHSYRDILVSDFPIRGKPSVITFRRRYWKLDGQKELLSNDIPVVFPGTKLETAFAAFLKAAGRDSASLLGEYRDFKSASD